ncbi:hypothetical protein M9H77_17389 [Catharanthus roseus]|uniref:Uncharacterized protein n=1 Tax=Catharanthus roseus TaxID=4058 RepID=A0ACC0B4G9_CATRO|nr:hypothetical protein M9H77_17389 [Catharanthus roseus]
MRDSEGRTPRILFTHEHKSLLKAGERWMKDTSSSSSCMLVAKLITTVTYAEENFLEKLPKKLIIGLTILFFSIASMLIAFTASFSIVLGHQTSWIIIPVALDAFIPTTLFALSQFPLVANMIHSTYGSGIFSRGNNVQSFIEIV